MQKNFFCFAALGCLIAVTIPTTSRAQNDGTPFSTGNNFIRQCASKTWGLACRTYTLGIFHGNQETKRTICLRPGVDGGQMCEIAIAYIRNNPQESDNAAFAMILDGWRKVFPCPANSSAPK